MSTNLEYRARERQRERESERQASEAQREKGHRGLEREKKKTKHTFFRWKNSFKNVVAAVTK